MDTIEKPNKKAKIIGALAYTAAFIIAFYGVQQLFRPNMEKKLAKAALEVNKQTPIQIDEYTRLDSASSIGKTKFVYYYTLSMNSEEVNRDTINKYIRPGIIENVKNSPELKVFRDNNIEMNYRYYDRSGKHVLDILVTPDMYKK
ncbi:MAG: hypothetical protein CSA36_00445 [Draconibacterium sp.]|nr:MAG: hypothetical protein CSA36_00445 [Draconibacterium sp.]